jgi:hypothetical protein
MVMEDVLVEEDGQGQPLVGEPRAEVADDECNTLIFLNQESK